MFVKFISASTGGRNGSLVPYEYLPGGVAYCMPVILIILYTTIKFFFILISPSILGLKFHFSA